MSDHTLTISSDEINLESRPVELVVYGLGTRTEVHTTWLRPNSTYGDVSEQLTDWDNTRSFTVLLGNYGPIPHWTESDPGLLVGDTCRTLYAIAGNETTSYVLGVVRTSESDYPIPIYDLTQSSTLTVSQAIVAAQPALAGKIKSITRYTGSELVEDTRYDDEVALRSNQSPAVSTVFIITISEPTAIFQTELVEDSIPSFLRIPYVQCGHLLRRAYALDAFYMQMIHLSSAILHLICSMAADLKPTITKSVAEMTPLYSADNRMSKLLSVAPLLSRELQLLIEDMEKLVNELGKKDIDQREIQSEVNKLFTALCRDYPGATAVRHSYGRFSKMASIDGEEKLQLNKQQLVHTPPTRRYAPTTSSYVPTTTPTTSRSAPTTSRPTITPPTSRPVPPTSSYAPPTHSDPSLNVDLSNTESQSESGQQRSYYQKVFKPLAVGLFAKVLTTTPTTSRSVPTSRPVPTTSPPTSPTVPPTSSYAPPTGLFANQNPEIAQTQPLIALDDTPGMGKGYRALTFIPKGTLVLGELPTILLRANLPPQQRGATIEHAVQGLPAGARQQFSALQISYRFGVYGPTIGRFLTNALPCEDDIHSAGLFMSGARFNSSCTPNVHQYWNGTHMEFRAMEHIQPRQELFICYNIRDLLFPRSERRNRIERICGFECQCVRCLEQSQDSDGRRLRIGAALGIKNHSDYQFSRHNLNMIIGALRDLQQEGLCHYRDALLYDGYHVCVAAGDGNNAMLWLRKAYEAAVVAVGEHSPVVQKIVGLIKTLSPDQIYFQGWVQLLPPPE